MARMIAVAGKGGTGKTTFNALLIRYLLEKGMGSILAVDADPNANLNEVLGLDVPLVVSDVLEKTRDRSAIPEGMPKDLFVQYQLSQALIETPKMDLLVMGRPEGPGCYCYANDLLKGHLEKLSQSYDFIIVDNEAGMEHISRRTIQRPDDLFIISDSSVRGVRSAKRVYELVLGMKVPVKTVYLIVTMVRSEETWKQLVQEFEDTGVTILGAVPYDPIITEFDAEGKPLLLLPKTCAGLQAVYAMLDVVFEGREEERKYGSEN